jgi:hypothetical protein
MNQLRMGQGGNIFMNRLEFKCKDWYVDENSQLKSATKMLLPDYKGEEKECWHLRGRAWRWVILQSHYPLLILDEEYELCFWGKFDYYSGKGTRCYIEFSSPTNPEEQQTYNITPNVPQAVASAGDWVLYKFGFKALRDRELFVKIIAFEANIAIHQAYPGDETNAGVTILQPNVNKTPFVINNELPFKEYASLEQRMVKYYSDLMAPYYPCKDISEVCQREYYDFVKGNYDKLFTVPEEFFRQLNEDDAHPNRFNNTEYGKPELKRRMKSDQAKIEELFEVLHEIGKSGAVEENGIHMIMDISRKQKKLLSYLGFNVIDDILVHEEYKNIGNAIKYLAEKEKALWSLMYCWFDDNYPYLEKTYAKHYNREQYERLTNWLHENDYRSSIGSCSGVTLDYYKCITEEDKPLGYAIHGDKFHYGFTFEFRCEPRVMQHCEPRIIQYGEMLKRFDELSENTKHLILQRTKRCDACRYCVQTDKTGKRPLAAIKLSDGTARCPYYPGFNYSFERLMKQDVDSIIAFLSDLEKLVI